MLEIEDLCKAFAPKRNQSWREVRAIDHVSLLVAQGDFFTLLGPSGCGKTTLLRSVGGLERPDSGVIRIDGEVRFSGREGIYSPASERGLGMVFQSYAIWPHMNVFDNAAFPLTVQRPRPSKNQIRERVDRILAAVELEHLATRMATDLSGGQQQRLALARALVQNPPLLLLDEPLSNLDAKLRQSMRSELKRLQEDLGLTILYVTHDQTEALAMSTNVAVLRDGHVDQLGTPQEIYEHPTTRFVADFVGVSNFLLGTVASAGASDGQCVIQTSAGAVAVKSQYSVSKDERVEISLRPEHIGMSPADPSQTSAVSVWSGTVRERSYLGEAVDYVIETGDLRLLVKAHPRHEYAVGDPVTLTFSDAGSSLLKDTPDQHTEEPLLAQAG